MVGNLEKKDIAIIGAGPAGLSAAIYAYRASKNLVLIEHQLAGGQLLMTSLIENYPGFTDGMSGVELAQKMKEHLEETGVGITKVKAESVKEDNGSFIVNAKERKFRTKAVIIATGAVPRRLNIPNKDKFVGRGISYCAICDGPLYKDKMVAVIGGGDVALEEALFLSQFAKKVFLVHRRDEFRAVSILQERVKKNEKIEVLHSYTSAEIVGNNKVEAIKLIDKKTHQIKELNIDGVFVFIGSEPNSGLIKELVKTDEKGFIITDSDMRTSKRGIYAAGDVRSKMFKQVVLACSEGAQAALCASKYIDEN